ncbi:helix-turn-helix domain-containing protein [Streptomyces atriruber]|uniref:helix-turn-helix domain-containing protein n=1 Tax=Streptomyces atriruber TaxID=545121 RepID=UPI0006E14DDD|nr:pyridoxamine 5'-phosphate oxidase family protein [Streptomyces atriruber]
MSEQSPPSAVPAENTARGDTGRRIAARRTELGLSRQAAADRAGMVSGYLKYLEEQATATPSPGTLMRLAGALETTVKSLCGANADLPPGVGRAASHPILVVMSDDECRQRLASHGIGRLAHDDEDGPVVVPVNYTVVDGTVILRTAPGTTPAAAVGKRVAFEVDRIDDALSQGWSVLVRGRAEAVTDPVTVRRLAGLAHSEPWVGGLRELWVRIGVAVLSGRRIKVR